ncbi:hypothetical protein LguiA_016644 [Lonicera macranthoides]
MKLTLSKTSDEPSSHCLSNFRLALQSRIAYPERGSGSGDQIWGGDIGTL